MVSLAAHFVSAPLSIPDIHNQRRFLKFSVPKADHTGGKFNLNFRVLIEPGIYR